MACGFMRSKSLPLKRLNVRPQAGRKSTGEEDGKRREEEILVEGEEENGNLRKQHFQIGVFTTFSDRR
jgi:hypothetical protein